MTIKKTVSANALELAIAGRIDTTTAPQLEAELKESIPGITDLKMDFRDVEYVSSAGLRVILAAQKQMNVQGQMSISHVPQDVMEVFDVTGFSAILTII